jgi:hypothetical protein
MFKAKRGLCGMTCHVVLYMTTYPEEISLTQASHAYP